jgi:hypothetical protein
MRQINLYLYDELPTEEAKSKARAWWVELELQDPAWIDDHRKSMAAAMIVVTEETDAAALKRKADACEFTGYCADALLGDMIEQTGMIPLTAEVDDYYVQAWDTELSERVANREYIEETIRANEYEFLEDGTRYG